VAAVRSLDAEWWTLNVNAPGLDHEKIINSIRTTASRKEPDQPFGLIAVSVSGQDRVHDHVHIVTTSRAGSQAVRRQFAGIARAVTGRQVRTLDGALGLDRVLGYWQKNVAVDGGKWIISRSVRAARRDALAGLELPDPELDRLFDGTTAADARRKAVDEPKAFKAPSVAPDPLQAPPEPSYGLDAIDHPPADSARHPDEDSLNIQEIDRGNLTAHRLSPILSRVFVHETIHLEQSRREPDVACQTQDHSRTAACGALRLGLYPKRDPLGGIHRRCIRCFSPNGLGSLRHRAPSRQRVYRSRDPPAVVGRGPPAQGPSDR
jgi:hypothetical protein